MSDAIWRPWHGVEELRLNRPRRRRGVARRYRSRFIAAHIELRRLQLRRRSINGFDGFSALYGGAPDSSVRFDKECRADVSDVGRSTRVSAVETILSPPGPGKRRNIDFIASAFIGLISHPPAIWRKARGGLAEIRPHERERLAISRHRQRPDVGVRTENGIQDEAANPKTSSLQLRPDRSPAPRVRARRRSQASRKGRRNLLEGSATCSLAADRV
jgi:hypothetical protein